MHSAFVLLNCHFPFDKGIISKISQMPCVSSISRLEGRFDVIIKVDAETEDSLKEVISRDIQKIKGVDDTLSLVIHNHRG